ncbi:uncharacterized protein LOC135368771 [Ornithodoros turicata]|uniref:uncharacterized protein LOC135368771 n=1 Tax=Ornithodoros turicata TaxID=34597 RepID=UPI00313945BE
MRFVLCHIQFLVCTVVVGAQFPDFRVQDNDRTDGTTASSTAHSNQQRSTEAATLNGGKHVFANPCSRDKDCSSDLGLACISIDVTTDKRCGCAKATPVYIKDSSGIQRCVRAKSMYESCVSNLECSYNSPNVLCVDFLCYCPLPYVLTENQRCLPPKTSHATLLFAVAPTMVLILTLLILGAAYSYQKYARDKRDRESSSSQQGSSNLSLDNVSQTSDAAAQLLRERRSSAIPIYNRRVLTPRSPAASWDWDFARNTRRPPRYIKRPKQDVGAAFLGGSGRLVLDRKPIEAKEKDAYPRPGFLSVEKLQDDRDSVAVGSTGKADMDGRSRGASLVGERKPRAEPDSVADELKALQDILQAESIVINVETGGHAEDVFRMAKATPAPDKVPPTLRRKLMGNRQRKKKVHEVVNKPLAFEDHAFEDSLQEVSEDSFMKEQRKLIEDRKGRLLYFGSLPEKMPSYMTSDQTSSSAKRKMSSKSLPLGSLAEHFAGLQCKATVFSRPSSHRLSSEVELDSKQTVRKASASKPSCKELEEDDDENTRHRENYAVVKPNDNMTPPLARPEDKAFSQYTPCSTPPAERGNKLSKDEEDTATQPQVSSATIKEHRVHNDDAKQVAEDTSRVELEEVKERLSKLDVLKTMTSTNCNVWNLKRKLSELEEELKNVLFRDGITSLSSQTNRTMEAGGAGGRHETAEPSDGANTPKPSKGVLLPSGSRSTKSTQHVKFQDAVMPKRHSPSISEASSGTSRRVSSEGIRRKLSQAGSKELQVASGDVSSTQGSSDASDAKVTEQGQLLAIKAAHVSDSVIFEGTRCNKTRKLSGDVETEGGPIGFVATDVYQPNRPTTTDLQSQPQVVASYMHFELPNHSSSTEHKLNEILDKDTERNLHEESHEILKRVVERASCNAGRSLLPSSPASFLASATSADVAPILDIAAASTAAPCPSQQHTNETGAKSPGRSQDGSVQQIPGNDKAQCSTEVHEQNAMTTQPRNEANTQTFLSKSSRKNSCTGRQKTQAPQDALKVFMLGNEHYLRERSLTSQRRTSGVAAVGETQYIVQQIVNLEIPSTHKRLREYGEPTDTTRAAGGLLKKSHSVTGSDLAQCDNGFQPLRLRDLILLQHPHVGSMFALLHEAPTQTHTNDVPKANAGQTIPEFQLGSAMPLPTNTKSNSQQASLTTASLVDDVAAWPDSSRQSGAQECENRSDGMHTAHSNYIVGVHGSSCTPESYKNSGVRNDAAGHEILECVTRNLSIPPLRRVHSLNSITQDSHQQSLEGFITTSSSSNSELYRNLRKRPLRNPVMNLPEQGSRLCQFVPTFSVDRPTPDRPCFESVYNAILQSQTTSSSVITHLSKYNVDRPFFGSLIANIPAPSHSQHPHRSSRTCSSRRHRLEPRKNIRCLSRPTLSLWNFKRYSKKVAKKQISKHDSARLPNESPACFHLYHAAGTASEEPQSSTSSFCVADDDIGKRSNISTASPYFSLDETASEHSLLRAFVKYPSGHVNKDRQFHGPQEDE